MERSIKLHDKRSKEKKRICFSIKHFIKPLFISPTLPRLSIAIHYQIIAQPFQLIIINLLHHFLKTNSDSVPC